MEPPSHPDREPDHDIVIVGAGLAGIGMAVHLLRTFPQRNVAILDRRERVGGTWDLFRYPGVRSDSDMHTLGYEFAPWEADQSIARGPDIRDYIEQVARDHALLDRIEFGQTVTAASWDSASARWTLSLRSVGGVKSQRTARFVISGAGYYDYDAPYRPEFAGQASFAGDLLDPQFWPEDYDWTGKQVVVIGSGATAATLVPAMAEGAALVTLLQRTPSWYMALPAKDRIANMLRRLLPRRLAFALTRFKNTRLQSFFFKRSRSRPDKVGAMLTRRLRGALGKHYDETAFTPPYGPWDQRMCFVPDGDLFEAIKVGKARMVTDTIAAFEPDGLRLSSGQFLPADAVVTATGLQIAVMGKIAFTVDGAPVDFGQRYYYRACMFDGVPNFAGVFGYLNASWTLRVDLIGAFVARVLARMDELGARSVTPIIADRAALIDDESVYAFSSGYLQRVKHLLPKNATDPAWRLNQDYLEDRQRMAAAPVTDPALHYQ